MKVMFLACNPDGHGDLTLEDEITELQQVFGRATGEPVEFLVFPRLAVERFPEALIQHKPDVLHISGHGKNGVLTLADSDGNKVSLTSAIISGWLRYDGAPKLLYLNACDSGALAQALVSQRVRVAIGTSAPISNRTALAAASLFYTYLLDGESVQSAFDAGSATVQAFSAMNSTMHLHSGTDPWQIWPYRAPKLVARFVDESMLPSALNKIFTVKVGVIGCPSETTHLVFFTPDESFADWYRRRDKSKKRKASERDMASYLCRVVANSYGVDGAYWSEHEESVFGDYRIIALGVSAGGRTFTVTGSLCEALERFYALPGCQPLGQGAAELFRNALATLKSMNGSELIRAPVLGAKVAP